MSNSEPESPALAVSANGADPAPSERGSARSGVDVKLPGALAELEAPIAQQLSSHAGPAGAASRTAGGAAPAAASSGGAAPGAAGTAAAGNSPLEGITTWLTPNAGWIAPAALIALAAGAGAWWWKKRKAKAAAPDPAKKSKPALDMYADWKSFRKRLPRSMRRVLDELQPVIVLGNNASEKEMLSMQLSRVADNEQLFPTRVSYRGKGLDLHLGARSLVLVPSDEFLDAPASSEDESWRKVLLAVCRVRAPRVVVCLAQAPLDAGSLDEVTLWTSKLRAHIDVIVAVRNEDIELSVALAQSPSAARSTAPRSTDALFELLGSLGKHEGLEETLRLRIDALADQLSPRVEERRESAKRWVIEKLRRARKGWPRLLAHPEYDSARLLMLARFFEAFEGWSATLGAGLAELLVHDERRVQRVLGQELCFLPCVDRRLLGTLAAFAGPSETRRGRWRPNQNLVHRLVVASAASVVALGLWLAYESDEESWDEAATAALRYALYETDNELDLLRGKTEPEAQDFELVRRYVTERANLGGLLTFFERDTLRCMTVKSIRDYVIGLRDSAIRSGDTPEKVVQLIGLSIAGSPQACTGEEGAGMSDDGQRQTGSGRAAQSDQPRLQSEHLNRELKDTITKHVAQWRELTALSDNELNAYLALACPRPAFGDLQRYDTRAKLPPVLDLESFGEALERLKGQCRLTSDERMAMQKAETLADGWSSVAQNHGAALDVLEVVRRLETPSSPLFRSTFDPHRARLRAIADMSNEQASVQLLLRDLRPFSDVDGARKAALELDSLAAFNRQLDAHLSIGLPESEDTVVRLTAATETHVIDRRNLRASLLVRALDRLQHDFIDATSQRELAATDSEIAFFPDDSPRKLHAWALPAAIPEGVDVRLELPWRYTIAGFRERVLEPIAEMHDLLDKASCGDGKKEGARLVAEASDFIAQRLRSYLQAYADTWSRIYGSFTVTASDEAELAATLASLARPTSIQAALLRQVLKQTRLEAEKGWPYLDSLDLVSAPFDTLASVADEKALAEYQGILRELSNTGQDTTQASAGGWSPVSSPAAGWPGAGGAAAGDPASPVKAEDSMKAFIAGLSGFGRVVVSGLRDPKADLRQRAVEWADRVGLAPASSPPLMQPIEAAYARGVQSFERGLAYFWVQKSAELRAAITDRFPFNVNSDIDASVDALFAWLNPVGGRFSNEVLPIYELATPCRRRPCATLPPGMQSSVERLVAIQRALFDEKGEPKPLVFLIDPVPFTNQQLLPKRAVLKLGEERYEYFNTAPRTMAVTAPWNEAYVASLSVDLAGRQASDEVTTPIETRESPWAFLRLLAAANAAIDGRYAWNLDATLRGIRQGTVSVSYDVCRDVRRCGGLLERVFAWP